MKFHKTMNFNYAVVLHRTEEEIGEDNLKNLDIPKGLVDKFEQMEMEK